MKKIIRLKNVSFRYPNAVEETLTDISVNFEKNQFVTIIGPNGSGKSTLAKLLNGIILPSKGEVIINNINTRSEKDLWEIRKIIGIVFQNPENQIVASTVEDDVAFGLENYGTEINEMQKMVAESLSKVGLSSYKNFEPHYLSGGQKQKLAIAGILALRPEVIIFDEAASMLDPIAKRDIFLTIDRLNKKDGITVINITHSLQETSLSDRVIVMNEGKILLDGEPRKLFKEKSTLQKIGLDIPATVEISSRLREKGYKINDEILKAEELVREIWKLF